MNKRTWWKAAATALVVGSVGIAAADTPKVEQAVWTRATTPAPKPTEVVPAAASVPVSRSLPLPEQTVPPPIAQPNYPLPPKTSSDEVVLPKFRPASVPAPVIPVATLPQITMPPVSTTSAKVAVLPPIPPAVTEEPKTISLPVPKPEPIPFTKVPEPAKPLLPPIPITKVPEPAKTTLPPIPITKAPEPAKPTLPPIPISKVPEPAKPTLPPIPITKVPEPAKPALPITRIPEPVQLELPPIPEIAPPAQPVKSADVVKPVPPAAPDFNLRPAPDGNSVKTNDVATPLIPIIPPSQPLTVSRPKPVDGPMPPTEKYVFPIPEAAPAIPVTNSKPLPPALATSLPKPVLPELPKPVLPELPKPVPADVTAVPMILPGVPTAIEGPLPPKPIFNTIPTPGADPMLFKQASLAAAIGTALALAPATPVLAADPPETVDKKLAETQKDIKRLIELLEGRKDADGTPSPVDVGAVKDIKKLKDDVFALKNRVAELETELDKLKKSTTSLKPPAQPDPMTGKGVVRIENEYPVEITIVVNSMSYRVPANTKLDVTVAVGDFSYQLLNSGANLAPTKSPIKEKEIVRLRIK